MKTKVVSKKVLFGILIISVFVAVFVAEATETPATKVCVIEMRFYNYSNHGNGILELWRNDFDENCIFVREIWQRMMPNVDLHHEITFTYKKI